MVAPAAVAPGRVGSAVPRLSEVVGSGVASSRVILVVMEQPTAVTRSRVARMVDTTPLAESVATQSVSIQPLTRVYPSESVGKREMMVFEVMMAPPMRVDPTSQMQDRTGNVVGPVIPR